MFSFYLKFCSNSFPLWYLHTGCYKSGKNYCVILGMFSKLKPRSEHKLTLMTFNGVSRAVNSAKYYLKSRFVCANVLLNIFMCILARSAWLSLLYGWIFLMTADLYMGTQIILTIFFNPFGFVAFFFSITCQFVYSLRILLTFDLIWLNLNNNV